MKTRCGAVTWFGRCPFPATARVVETCVHEHIRGGFQCSMHASDPDRGLCSECAEPAWSHDCDLFEVKRAERAS